MRPTLLPQTFASSDLELSRDDHIYTFKGKVIPAVGDIVSEFAPFDAESKSRAIALLRAPDGSEDEILEIQAALLAEWDEKRRIGHAVHSFAEAIANGWEVHPQRLEERAVLAFWEAREDCEILAVEQSIANPSAGYGGTIDLLLREQGRIILVDYKTGSWASSSSSKCLHQLAHLPNCKAISTALKMMLYRYALERHYAIEVDSGWAVHLPEEGGYTIYEMPEMSWELQALLGQETLDQMDDDWVPPPRPRRKPIRKIEVSEIPPALPPSGTMPAEYIQNIMNVVNRVS